MVQAAEEGRTLSHDRRTRPGREDQPVLCVTGVAAEVAGAGDRGGDPGWKAAAGHNAARVDEGVSGGVGKVALASVRDSSSMQLPTQAPPVFRWPRPWCRVRCSGRSSQRLRRCAHNHHRPDVERRHRDRPRTVGRGTASGCRLGGRNSRRNGEHIAGHMANSAIMRPQALIVAGNRAYRSPKMPGCAEHMGNVG